MFSPSFMKRDTISSLSTFFEKAFITYCRILPKVCNRSFLTSFEILLERISELMKYSKLPVYLLSGKEKYSKELFTVFYAGNPDSIYYLSYRMFDETYTTKQIGTYSVFHLDKLMKRLPNSADIAIIKTDKFFTRSLQKFQFITIPEWVNMVLDTSKSFEELMRQFSSGARKDVKKINKYGYSYEITNDLVKMEFFYRRMFLPYILDRYGEEITQHYLEYIKMILKRNTMNLLLVKDGDSPLSAGLIDIKGKKQVLPSMGVLDADTRYLQRYASSALFYYHILSAKKRCIDSINYGDTRSFLNDGSFQYKRKWGMDVTISRFRRGLFGLKILKDTKAVSDFLAHSPFVFVEHNRLKAFLYLYEDQPATLVDLQHICRTYYTPGITELLILSPQGFTQQAKDNELFEITSKYNFVKSFTDVKVLNKKIQACVIRPKESMFNSFLIR